MISISFVLICGGGHEHLASINSYASHQRSEEHTSDLQSQSNLVCRLLLEKKNVGHPASQRRQSSPPARACTPPQHGRRTTVNAACVPGDDRALRLTQRRATSPAISRRPSL